MSPTPTPTPAKALTVAEQKRRDLARRSQGLLQEDWLHGTLWSLSLVGNPNVTVAVVSGSRPYRVIWKTSGDRKVNGEYKAIDFHRSRSFARVDSLLAFLEDFI